MLRDVDRTVLVLGSTQSTSSVDLAVAARRGVVVTRRRSGGGAVLLAPGAQVWADMWVPAGDELWADDPRAAASVAGEWWARALEPSVGPLEVWRGGLVPGGRQLVCFAGIGPGEVRARGKKVVGLAQWRSREGTLVHGCAYRRWDPRPLAELLTVPREEGAALVGSLVGAAAGIDELGASDWRAESLVAALPPGAPWRVERA